MLIEEILQPFSMPVMYYSANPFVSQDSRNRLHPKNGYRRGYLFKAGPVQSLLNESGCHFLPTTLEIFSEC